MDQLYLISKDKKIKKKESERETDERDKTPEQGRWQGEIKIKETVNMLTVPGKAKLYSITFIKYCLQWPKSGSLFPAAANLITCSTCHKTSYQPVNTATFQPVRNDWQPALLSVPRQSDMLLVRLFQIITSNHMS